MTGLEPIVHIVQLTYYVLKKLNAQNTVNLKKGNKLEADKKKQIRISINLSAKLAFISPTFSFGPFQRKREITTPLCAV